MKTIEYNAACEPRVSLSGSAIKIIALVSMTIDHLSKTVLSGIPEFRRTLFEFHGSDFSWCTILNALGHTAFPLFAFLIVEGFIHTRDRKKYGASLLAFALISEIPWNLVWSDSIFFGEQNVLFTLFLGYLGLCAWEKFKDCWWKQWTAILALFAMSYFFKVDYSCTGFATVLFLYLLRSSKFAQGLAVICMIPYHLFCAPASVCICLYNGRRGFIRGRWFKYFFYAYYPLHLLVLWLIRN